MSAASSNAKGWLLPVVTATYGFALIQRSRAVTLLGLAGRVGTVVGRWVPAWSVWSSWSILPFYGALLLIGIGIYIRAVIT